LESKKGEKDKVWKYKATLLFVIRILSRSRIGYDFFDVKLTLQTPAGKTYETGMPLTQTYARPLCKYQYGGNFVKRLRARVLDTLL